MLGNGVNRYKNNQPVSWEHLLNSLSLNLDNTKVPKGISFTEFFDILSISSKDIILKQKERHFLQKQFCSLIDLWEPTVYHESIVKWAKRNKNPILTTNFDSNLSDAINAKLQRNSQKKFTYYYPFESYYSDQQSPITQPSRQFAIWHVNGMKRYPASIRLGLTHYMGSVEKVRPKIQKGARGLYNSKVNNWTGSDSWLDVFFHCPLVFIGISLDETEIFLRWLLIQRAKYFIKFPERRKSAWYIYSKQDHLSNGKRFFLEGVGVIPLEVNDFGDLYSQVIWSS